MLLKPGAAPLLLLALAGCDGVSLVGGAAMSSADVLDVALDAASADLPDAASADLPDAADASGDAALDAPDAQAPAPDAVDVLSEETTDVPPPDAPDVAADIPTSRPASVETLVAPTAVAGQQLVVTCVVRDEGGGVLSVPTGQTRVLVSPENLVRREEQAVFASRPGSVDVACELPAATLVDRSPARVTISLGPPASTRAVADPSSVVAGAAVSVSCTVLDREGNVLPTPPAPPVIHASPQEGARVEGTRVTLERAGPVDLTCRLAALQAAPASVQVRPAGAVSLHILRTPNHERYEVGMQVIFDGVARDRFGNDVPGVPTTWSVTPMALADPMGPNYLRFPQEGTYTVSARATGEGGRALAASTEVLVDNFGPTTQCTSPTHASMLAVRPGEPIVVTGTARDVFGVQEVRVRPQGAPDYTVVPIDGDGNWTARIPAARFGGNYLDIVATDRWGNTALDSCGFLVADRWVPEGGAFGGALEFYLGQRAIDDGAPVSPISSINDILQRVISGPSLATEVGPAIQQANPVFNNPCAARDPLFGQCVSVRIDVTSLEVRGPNSSSLQLVSGGMRVSVVAQDVIAHVRVTTSLGTYTGTATFPRVAVTASYDVALVGGRPRATLRPGSAAADVSAPVISLNGLPGFANAVINGAVSASIPPVIAPLFRDTVAAQMGAALNGVLGSIDVRAFARSVQLPGFDGMNAATFAFGAGLNVLDATASVLRMGLATTTTGPTRRNTASRGVAIPGDAPPEPAMTTPAAVAMHVGVFNQVLHAMWRAGLFDTDTPDVTVLGNTGTVRTRIGLPPVTHLDAHGDLIVDIAAIDHSLMMVDPPLVVRIGVRLRARPTVRGTAIQFGTFELTELHFAPLRIPLGVAVAQTAEMYFRPYIQTLTGEALGRALPSVPVPSFLVPPELAAYGLPVGTELGITAPTLAVEGQRFIVRGSFGEITR